MKRILDSLPDPIMASLQATISNTLSSFSPNEVSYNIFPKFFLQHWLIFLSP